MNFAHNVQEATQIERFEQGAMWELGDYLNVLDNIEDDLAAGRWSRMGRNCERFSKKGRYYSCEDFDPHNASNFWLTGSLAGGKSILTD